jgi:hypothetical protein
MPEPFYHQYPLKRGLGVNQAICRLWKKDKSLAPAWDEPKIPEIPTLNNV